MSDHEHNNEGARNPLHDYLRLDRMPSIWCPGCGIGASVNAFTRALIQAKADRKKTTIVSGIGCTGRVSGYLDFDSFHTTHGRAIPFATGLKLGNPDLDVVVYSGEGDLVAIGGNHLIHAARRNMDLLVICVNNFTYGMTGGQVSPTSPGSAMFTTAPFGQFEEPFNLPQLADAAGAVYVARWTTFHVRQLTKSIREAMGRRGFRFIEVISGCPTLYQRRNKLGDGLDAMRYYREKSVIKNHADTSTLKIDFQSEITVGTFVERERPTFLEAMNTRFSKVFGDKYVPYPRREEAAPATIIAPPVEVRRPAPASVKAPMSTAIKLGGFGGQGVILSGMVIGKAAALYDDKEATLIQAFGPEARGSACSAQVMVSNERIFYPYVLRPDIMVLMSQDAYNRFGKEVKPKGTLILEADLVDPKEVPNGAKVLAIPATRLAEELGRKLVLNIVMVGFFAATTKVVDADALRRAVQDSVPKATIDLNLQAFDKGFAYGRELVRAG